MADMRYLLLVLITCLPALALSHDGGVDKSGCHNDKQSGERHCHNRQLEAVYHYGKVISVSDGNTIKIRVDSKVIKVRLAEVYAPELNQDYGMKAKQYLGNLVFAKDVRVKEIDWDKYGRLVGRVYLGRVDVNSELVRNGYAWAYLKYLTDRSLLKDEAYARRNKRGLWGGHNPVQPWVWIEGRR